jgi:hypothetical protein
MLFSTLLVVAVNGCALALYRGSPPSVERLRIQATQPDELWLQVDASGGRDYEVPQDGKVTVSFPEVPETCQSLLFGVLPLEPKPGPARLLVRRGWWTTVRQLNWYALQELPVDQEGYRVIEVAASN